MLLSLALFACDPVKPVTVTGNVRVGPFMGEGPVTEGRITILDGAGEFFDESPIGPDGTFQVTGPESLPLVAVVDGPGLVESTFAGVLGVGAFQVPEGAIYGWSDELMETLRSDFGACGSVPGAVIAGEIHLFGSEDSNGDVLRIDQGVATLYNTVTGAEASACYLDDLGVYDPDASLTGETGRFAFFGLDAGTYQLVYGYELGGTMVESELFLFVREDGITPLFPAYIDVPL